MFRLISGVGVLLTLAGSTALGLGFLGIIDFADYALGLSAGVRVLGSVAIAGCLVSAIGFFGLEYGK